MERKDSFFDSLKKEIKAMRTISRVLFFLAVAFYYCMLPVTMKLASSRSMLILWGERIPYSAFTGVVSSLSNMVLVVLVVFFGKLGFLTSLVITAMALMNLTKGILVSHILLSLPGFCFMITTLISLIIIHRRNEQVKRMQDEKLILMKVEQEHLNKVFAETAQALASAIDAKDRYTHGHSTRVAEYSKEIAKRAGKSENEINDIYFAALLHDVGKIGVSEAIINKKGKLSDYEFDQVKKHTVLGWEILSNITSLPYLNIGAHYHHEKFD